MNNKEQFKWDENSAKDFCEYVGLRVGKKEDIRQQVNLLCEDFKKSKATPIEVKVSATGYYCRYEFETSALLSNETLVMIEELIKKILNPDPLPTVLTHDEKKLIELYTEVIEDLQDQHKPIPQNFINALDELKQKERKLQSPTHENTPQPATTIDPKVKKIAEMVTNYHEHPDFSVLNVANQILDYLNKEK